MPSHLLHLLVISITTLTLSVLGIPSCSDIGQDQATIDYIVVGAGAGGGPVAARLAENGFSVTVIEAGEDEPNVNTTLPIYFIRGVEDNKTQLSYRLDEYPPSFRIQRNNVWYPRARAIGGSTIHNALINIIGGTRPDFDGLASRFNDTTWSRNNMQQYFRRLEKNVYPLEDLVNISLEDHGFDGWLKTSLLPAEVFVKNPTFLDPEIAAITTGIPAKGGLPILDLNGLAEDGATGWNLPSFTIDENHNRSTVRERLLAVEQSSSSTLQIMLGTLATKVLTCLEADGTTISAYGVDIAQGAALPVAGNFEGKQNLTTKSLIARHEVIVSAGAFQSPQLLMLSGIGDTTQLSQFGIETVVNLPGVGTNLQDHDEVSVIWNFKSNFSLYNGCTFLYTPEDDPCLKYWIDSNHENLYSFGPALAVTVAQSSSNLSSPDIFTYYLPGYFEGFVQGFGQKTADHHGSLTAIILKGHPSSIGSVTLTGPSIQDPLKIQKNHFQAPNGPRDVATMRDGIKKAREIVQQLPIWIYVDKEVFPGAAANTDAKIEEHIYEHVFGHHACCTNPMGKDGDPNAVLDGDFRVRGVNNLRVVDASSWPIVPGYFVTTPIYMMSEKAADVILASAKHKIAPGNGLAPEVYHSMVDDVPDQVRLGFSS